MGVKGLWSLLQPVNRPIKIETLEGKRLAIDSSIWLYQFQATMKDKEGRTLNNAHILGFLRRINKLLFHGIKPVFVFDGVSPALKRNTIAERKQRKAGATLSHAKMAAKLLAAQLRSAAVKQARTRGGHVAADAAAAQEEEEEDTGDIIPADATFLDDFEQGRGRPAPNAAAGPSRPRRRSSSSSSRSPSPVRQDDPEEPLAKKKYVAKDAYELPAMPDKPNGARNDPRLATDEELKAFIDDSGIDLDLDALDTTSAEFQTLPRDTQYDIVNDLRLRSRAPNYHRLQTMLSAARTPLDFSKAQIMNLQKRNQLSQQMWSMAGIDTKAFTISVAGGRVAGERGKEYVLVKNEGTQGGWVLGIRDEGTSDKPIELEAESRDVDARKMLEDRDKQKSTKRIEGGVLRSNKPITIEDEEEQAEMERRSKAPAADPDLRENRRKQALEALAARYSPKKASSKKVVKPYASFGPARPAGAAPLFAVDDEDEDEPAEVDADELLAAQLQAEDLAMDVDEPKEEDDDLELARALEESGREASRQGRSQSVVQLDDDGWEKPPEFDSSGDEMEEIAIEGDAADLVLPITTVDDGDEDGDSTFRSDLRHASLLSRMSSVSRRSGSGSAAPFDVDMDDDQLPVAGPGPRTLAHWTGEDAITEDVVPTPPAPVATGAQSSLPHRPATLSTPAPRPDIAQPTPGPTLEPPRVKSASRNATSDSAVASFVPPPPSSQRHPPTAVPLSQPSRARPPPFQPKKDVITLSDTDSDDDMEPVEFVPPPQPVDRPLPSRRTTAPSPPPAHSPSASPQPARSPQSRQIARSPTPPPRPLSPMSIARTFSASSERPSPVKRTSDVPSPVAPSPSVGSRRSISAVDARPAVAAKSSSTTLSPHVATSKRTAASQATSIGSSKPTAAASVDLPTSAPVIGNVTAVEAVEADDAPSSLASLPQVFQQERSPSPAPLPPRQPTPPAPLFDADPDAPIEWSPSPTPEIRARSLNSDEAGSDIDEDELHAHQDGDEAAEEVEEDNYASFLAGVKGKDLNAVQEELDAEVERLRKDKRKMTRDGDENITAQMVGQIQLLLQRYGIPYITAPSEAEAQCAELASLNLVDGIITDDSDVFLFGGKQCFKNLFNDHKYVECYVLSDFDRELCLTQERLVTLAFLLGSDYTAGVPGVGYVTAMEIMAEFPGDGDAGLVNFRNWWIKVQSGKDTEEDTGTKWRQSFKKKFLNTIHLTPEFPNPQVRPAYLHPQVDSSTEPFTWGLPNLHTLRPFLTETLQWLPSKVDEVLDPIIKRNDPATKAAFQRKQITLDGFFDASVGGAGGFFGGVKRGGGNGGASERLRRVVERMRVRDKGVIRKMEGGEGSTEEEEEEVVKPPPKKRAKGKATKAGDEADAPAPPKRKRARPLKANVSNDDADPADGEDGASTSARGRGRGRGRARGRGRGTAAATGARKPRKKKNASPTPTPSPTPSLSGDSDDDADLSPPKAKRARPVQDSDDDQDQEEATPVVKKTRPKPKARLAVREEPEEEEMEDLYGAL